MDSKSFSNFSISGQSYTTKSISLAGVAVPVAKEPIRDKCFTRKITILYCVLCVQAPSHYSIITQEKKERYGSRKLHVLL